MAEIKKVYILSLLKIVLVFSLVFGLIWGIFMSVYIANLANINNPQLQALAEQAGISPDQIVASYQGMASKIWFSAAILSVIFSLIFALIAVLIYNLTAKWWGGIKIDLEK